MAGIVPPPSVAHAVQPGLSATVKHMAGLLWYEMLSELNKSGLDSDLLGTGGDDFQGMFLWNIAQNDFGKYDTALTEAMLRQIGGAADLAPGPAAVPDFPAPLLQATQLQNLGGNVGGEVDGDAGAIAANAAIAATPVETQPAADIVAQAENFAKSVWPQITAAAQQLDVPPVAVLAQSALETAWGNAAPGNNLFGIKAVDGQAATTRPTHEMIDGVLTPQNADFRDYPSMQDSISDYVGQIQAGFPDVIGQGTVAGFAGALQQSGYATDSSYAAKIITISQSPLMAQVLRAVGGSVPTKAGSP